MGMRNEDKVDRGQMMNFESRLLQPLDHFEPLRPDRVDQEVELVRLDEEGGVTNPGNTDFAFADLADSSLKWMDARFFIAATALTSKASRKSASATTSRSRFCQSGVTTRQPDARST